MLRSLASDRASWAAFSRSNISNGILVRFDPQRASMSIIPSSLLAFGGQEITHEGFEIVEDSARPIDVVDQVELQAEALKRDLQQRRQPLGRHPELRGNRAQRGEHARAYEREHLVLKCI